MSGQLRDTRKRLVYVRLECRESEALAHPQKSFTKPPPPLLYPQVSSGLIPRLKTLMPQMERLAKGTDCTPLPDTDPLAPQCTDPENYSPAFWPERLSRKGQHTTSFGSAGDGDPQAWSRSENGRRKLSAGGEAAVWSGQGGMRERGNSTNFRVIVATDSAEAEEILQQYNVS